MGLIFSVKFDLLLVLFFYFFRHLVVFFIFVMNESKYDRVMKIENVVS